MTTNEHTHPPRPKFDTLFADPRHYRGDCRLMRTAIRRGWLNDAPQADRDALVARFEEASREREAAGYATEGQRIRAALAEARAAIDLASANVAPALRYSWAGELTNRTTGRPRERWHVSNYAHRIDANELRRRVKADGMDLRTLRAIDVRPAADDGGERVALAVVADARYGWRVWLVCPRCGTRRVHLFHAKSGIGCRRCVGLGYADARD